MNFLDMLLRLLLALLLGGLVGLERERRDRPAGLRTHILVCLGSTLVTLISIHVGGVRGDPGRIAAQIVSGIGFLGAGTIFRSGTGVRGLTTAAGLWVVAAIGMGIGAGGILLPVAATTALLVFGTNIWVRILEDRLLRTYREVVLRFTRGSGLPGSVFEELESRRVAVHHVQWISDPEWGDEAGLRLRVRLPTSYPIGELTAWLAGQHGMRSVEWE